MDHFTIFLPQTTTNKMLKSKDNALTRYIMAIENGQVSMTLFTC